MSGAGYTVDSTLSALLKDMGIDPANALRRAGFAEDLLRHAPIRLPASDYYRLWAGIEHECGDPLLPIRMFEAVRAESFSPPLFAALCSPTLHVAMERTARYKSLVAPMRLSVNAGDDLLAIDLTWHDAAPEPPLSLVMVELLFCVALGRIGTRENMRPARVETPILPASLEPYEEVFGVPVMRGGGHRIAFSMTDARRPFLTSCESLWNAFEPELRQRLADLDQKIATDKRVRAVLLEGLPAGIVTMDAVARKLAMSRRTLQRRIGAEGTSFQRILKETRESLARHYLEKTALPPAEISFLLGFDEPNSFYRAFRSWTGMTPDSVRHARSRASPMTSA